MRDEFITHFWERVDKRGPGGCWLWTKAKFRRGYGAVWFDGKNLKAHRVAWLITHGDIPNGLWVLHECDTPSCVNPAHLWLGTTQQNTEDKVRKGRAHGGTTSAINHPEKIPRGEQHGGARLTEANVREIRQRYAAGDITQDALAAEYKVARTQISRITTGVRWAHVV